MWEVLGANVLKVSNVALFLRFDFCLKTPLKQEKLENSNFPFSCGLKTFLKRSFLKTMASRCDFPAQVFLKHKPKLKMTGDWCVFQFLQRRVNGKHLMRFQIETNVFKFLLRSIDGANLIFVCPGSGRQ